MLTKRQQEVFDYIQEFQRDRGYTPSIREIAAHFDVQVHAAHGHVQALEKKGFLKRASGKGRALSLAMASTEADGWLGLRLPLAAVIPAGSTVAVEDQLDQYLELSPSWFGKGQLVAVRVMGNSMAGDAISDGDLAIIQLQKTALPTDIVAVRVAQEEVTLKRIKQKDAVIDLCPSNPQYPIRQVPADEVEIIGKLVGIIRKT